MLEFKLIYGLDGYRLGRSVREEVFIREQGFSYDYDEFDDTAWHIIGFDQDKPIAAARLLAKADGIFVIGRVAVIKGYRKQYIGDTLLRALEDKAVQLKGHTIEIGAQERSVGFYLKEGYEKCGEIYYDEDCPHYPMTKDLTCVRRKCGGCPSC